ncbi:hypothetical protein NPIL_368431, partial [Nephila pilipes]
MIPIDSSPLMPIDSRRPLNYLCPIEEKFQDTTSEFYQEATPCISLLSKQEPRRR